MGHSFVHEASNVVSKPEVQSLIRELSKHGLAVCIPHMHREEDGAFQPLPDGIVQSEADLRVSFVKREALDENDIPVAWVWDKNLKVVQSCRVCHVDGPHH